VAVVQAEPSPVWTPERRPLGWGDLVALLAWTAAIALFFRDAVFLRKALFYFDITEINYPYRDFLAREIRLGRFSRWMPGLYCGLPLYSESQAGYWHPLKYLLYPWLATWKAFNLDTILSVWLTGLATFGWLRRHVGPAGALTGAAIFGLSGFVWAHLIHTSMTNALISVPLAIWALEVAWDGGRLRGLALGGLAIACQVFAGHLQDTILTAGVVGLYAIHRAATEATWRNRLMALGFAAAMIGVGVLVSAVQWIPSKELLDRSPRAGGLTWDQLTYGSWSPELLPTLVVREAYGTRARDTDWMDGYYPYHEMNAYLGLIGLGLAIVGGAACRDRWVSFWIALAMVGGLLMLGRFTFVFDFMHRVPVLGSSRIPVRYHLWVSLAVAALAAVGVDRLGRPGGVRLRGATLTGGFLIVASIAILVAVYTPAWSSTSRWTAVETNRSRWLVRELAVATTRSLGLAFLAWIAASKAARSAAPATRRRLASLLPVLVIADLLGAHIDEVPTIDPSYWTVPPASVDRLKADLALQRVFGDSERSAGEPGYASRRVDFFPVRDGLEWSLAPVWGVGSSSGITPIIPRRMLAYTDHARPGGGRFDIEGVSHLLNGYPLTQFDPKPIRVGETYIHRNPNVFPRARLMGRPVYAADEADATGMLDRLGPAIRDRLVVEDPDRPLDVEARPEGTATLDVDEPERVEVETASGGPSYLVLADTFDPGWSATVDGKAAPIRPAYVAFRAVFLPGGSHKVVFTYRPAGFRLGLIVTGVGIAAILVCLAWPRRLVDLGPPHATLAWPRRWPLFGALAIVIVVAASAIAIRPGGSLAAHSRWRTGFHGFTWGARIAAIPETRNALGR
jgi:hypothetical protein